MLNTDWSPCGKILISSTGSKSSTATVVNSISSNVNVHFQKLGYQEKQIQGVEKEIQTVVNNFTAFQNSTNSNFQNHDAKIQVIQTTQGTFQEELANAKVKLNQVENTVIAVNEQVSTLQNQVRENQQAIHLYGDMQSQEREKATRLNLQVQDLSQQLESLNQENRDLRESYAETLRIVSGLKQQFQAFQDINNAKERENALQMDELRQRVKAQEQTIDDLKVQANKIHRASGEFSRSTASKEEESHSELSEGTERTKKSTFSIESLKDSIKK